MHRPVLVLQIFEEIKQIIDCGFGDLVVDDESCASNDQGLIERFAGRLKLFERNTKTGEVDPDHIGLGGVDELSTQGLDTVCQLAGQIVRADELGEMLGQRDRGGGGDGSGLTDPTAEHLAKPAGSVDQSLGTNQDAERVCVEAMSMSCLRFQFTWRRAHLPIGAPIPLLRQSEIVWKGAQSSLSLIQPLKVSAGLAISIYRYHDPGSRFTQTFVLHGQPSFTTDMRCDFPNPSSVQVHGDIMLGSFVRDLNDFVLREDGSCESILEANQSGRCRVNVVAELQARQDVVF